MPEVPFPALLWRQYRLERRMFWRNPTAAFFNFVLPLIFLALFGAVFSSNQKNLDVIVPGIAGMSVLSTTFTALAYNMTFLREQGILKRIRGTPLPTGAYLGGIALSAITNTAIQISIVVVAGKLVFGLPWPLDWPELIIFVVAGVGCFAALGVAFSHAIPNFESTAAYVNAVFLPLLGISGVFFDAARAPAVIKDVAEAFPLVHVINGISGAMVKGTSLAHNAPGLGVVAVWGVAGAWLAMRGFSWESRRA